MRYFWNFIVFILLSYLSLCSRPTPIQESARDSDEEFHDRDYHIATSSNNSSQTFPYRGYENDDMDEVIIVKERIIFGMN